MAREGAKVVVADINGEGAEKVAGDIRAGGGDAIAVATDVSREADVRAMVAAAVDTFGALHVLHNNAAITSADHLALDGAVVDMELDVFISNTLLPRVGVPDDIANVVVFLSSDRAAFVTGQIIKADGGQLSHLPHFAYLLDSGLTTTKTGGAE